MRWHYIKTGSKELIMDEQKIYSDAAWTVADISGQWICTEDEAKSFSNKHDRHLRDWMVEQGWFWLEHNVPFPKRKED